MYFSKPNFLKKPTFENGLYAKGQLNSGSYLLYYFLSSQKAPKSSKKFQDRNPYNIFDAILENRCLHKFILSLTDL